VSFVTFVTFVFRVRRADVNLRATRLRGERPSISIRTVEPMVADEVLKTEVGCSVWRKE
jgi:hypothetical protein